MLSIFKSLSLATVASVTTNPVVEETFDINVFQQVVDSRGMVLLVLLVLIAMSIACWFIIAYKWLQFRKLRQQSQSFVDTFWRSETLDGVWDASERLADAPVARVFRAAYTELGRIKAGDATGLGGSYGFENIERTLRRAQQAEQTRLERLVPFLATTGSSAPFIGLFGTVWGIMNAFAYIRPDQPVLQTVTPHIAQALVATAIGLLAAIPAVMAFNYFNSKIRVLMAELENFGIDFLNVLKRQFFRQ
ncbi:MAG TPA: MotA/TolQ/ExbB proton channel family protein [Myxococcota bacterium]|jgi:biopolymer transport protein TolQ|nr:MotA/TolQ/ExbB proton channel family protein [Myxococcota bacterium]HQL57310.1 MotA/TolQ/ExbB proton channel family protein [Myxococcota bacterium]